MLVTFQFPITDFRDLLKKSSLDKLPIANFLGYKNSKNGHCGMIHNLGGAYPSISKSESRVLSYGPFFQAKNLIRFYEPGFGDFRPILRGVRKSRRYYYDGTSIGRFEINLTTEINNGLKIEYIKSIISQYANLPVKIDVERNKEENILIKSRNSIAIAYYKSTTKKNVSDDLSVVPLLVKSGRPFCIVQLNKGDKIKYNPETDEKIELGEGLNLYYFVDEKSAHLKVYVLESAPDTPTKNIEDFRYAISRINAEKENIFNLHAFIKNLPEGEEADDFRKKIIDCIKKLQEGLLYKRRFGIEITEIVKLAVKIENEIDRESVVIATNMSNEIADKYSITQLQLIFSEVDYKKIIDKANNELHSGKYPTDSEEYKFIEELISAAEKKSKHMIIRVLKKPIVKKWHNPS